MGDPERFYVKTDYSHGGTQPADQKKEPKLTASPDQLKTFVEGLKANFSLPKVKLSGVVLSKDHNQRGAEVKEHLSKRRGLENNYLSIPQNMLNREKKRSPSCYQLNFFQDYHQQQ